MCVDIPQSILVNPMATETVNMTLRLPPELAAYLHVVSQKTGKSRHQVIIDALAEQYNSDTTNTATSNPEATEGHSNIDYIIATLKSFSARLDRLEGVKDAKHDGKSLELPEFYIGQEITGQHSKLYQLLLSNCTAKQKLTPKVKGWRRKPTTFALFKDLGLLCIVNRSRNGKAKFEVCQKFDLDTDIYISAEGEFLTEELDWLEAEDSNPSNHQDISEQDHNDVVVSEYLSKPTVRATPYQLNAVGTKLSLDELKLHLDAIGSTHPESLTNMSSQLIKEGEVSELLDTDWLLYWLPLDYSDRRTWILSKKSTYGI